MAVHDQAVLFVERWALFGGRPGHAKGVRGPQADGGDGEEDVLARLEFPGAGEFKGDAHGIAGERLENGVGGAAAGVAVDEGEEADATLPSPGPDDDLEVD